MLDFPSMILITLYMIIGLLTGILSGLLGLGGGILIVPALAWLFSWQNFPSDLSMHMATSTSLAIVMLTTAVTTWSQQKRKAVAWEFLRYLVPGMVLGAIIGTSWGQYLSSQSLRYAFAAFCFILSIKLILTHEPSLAVKPIITSKAWLFFAGVVAGVLAGLLGIGGGAILIPILMWFGLSMPVVSGTAAACTFPTAVTGTILSIVVGLHISGLPAYSLGYIYLPAVLILGIGSMIAVPVGVALAHRLPEKIVKRIFGVILMLIAWKMTL